MNSDYNISFCKCFGKRCAVCFFILMFLFFGTILKLAATATTEYSPKQTTQNKLSITVSKQRKTIFDCNMIPLTNNRKKIIAAVSPTQRAITAIGKELSGEKLEKVLKELKSGKIALCEVEKEISCDGIVTTEIYTTANDISALHLLGYTNNEAVGLSGIQKAYDSFLNSENEVKFIYECDAKGNILKGLKPTVEKDSSVEASGIVTTIDINIQNIAETAAGNISKGAIIISEAANGKIRACVSQPDFDLNKISEYLSNEDSPLLNRAINAYNVGSVFKPCVAAAGIESRNNNFYYTCTGSYLISDRYFKCHKYDGHGEMNLCTALANSCNTYFYNFALNIGKTPILNMAQKLRFGKALKLCENFYTATGNLPKEALITTNASLANLSIGQGELLLSPISILPLYSAIASNGEYYIPSVVEGKMENGSLEKYDIGHPTKVMSDETAKLLRDYLKTVLTEGTGKAALPKNTTAAGKTATAQTGVFENGKEICQGWFCGFFPAENPKYVAVIFSEDTEKQSLSCAEIFSFIADSIVK